jgi:signal transduction histidine kinase
LLRALEQSQAAGARAAGLAERQRLDREMHDVLAHSPSGLLLQLEGARMLAADNPTDPRIPEAIDRADHLGERPPQPGNSGGYGLTGMRERAELLGGTLTTEQTPRRTPYRRSRPLAIQSR